MRNSQSATSLLATGADIAEAGPTARARRRSSLDTFVIPGRTRVPSSRVSQPEPMDIQIARGLLNPDSLKVSKQQSHRVGKHGWLATNSKKPSVLKGKARSNEEQSVPASPKKHMEKSKKAPRMLNDRELIIIPKADPRHKDFVPQPREHQLRGLDKAPWILDDRELMMVPKGDPRLRQNDPVPQPQEHQLQANEDDLRRSFGGTRILPKHDQVARHKDLVPQLQVHRLQVNGDDARHSFDGARSEGSRVTSTTRSSISYRIFSNSSSNSQNRGSAKSVEEYNVLALRHGLPQFAVTAEIEGIANDGHTEVTSKTHHNWIMRKLLRRSTPSTYQLNVKAKQKSIKRTASFSSISSLLEKEHKDLLKDKSLEEVGRLGGLSILLLPRDFAVDKLTLPTCISATATYLVQQGCKTPGIFRVPGQLNTINALYDFYAHRYANASDPDLVQQTVGSGLLPTHIPHNPHDVASLFKKIVSGLPGGLLGSLSLFAALRSIAQDLHWDSKLSELEFTDLKARLIALAISSVTSSFRVSLICAVLGVAALVGHEAEQDIARSRENDKSLPADLMNYQSLGVVLGPLLLGELTYDASMAVGSSSRTQLPVPNSLKKTRKEKHATTAPNKLERYDDFLAQVEQAKITAVVMQMLVSSWKDVVKQLRHIDTEHLRSSRLEKDQKLPSTQSRLTLKSSDEDVIYDFLRGRTLPENWEGSVKIRQKLRVPSRSPVSFNDIRASDPWFPEPIEKHLSAAEAGSVRTSTRRTQENGYEISGYTADTEPARDFSGPSVQVKPYHDLPERTFESDPAVDLGRNLSGQTLQSDHSVEPGRDFSGHTVQSNSSLFAARSEPKGQLLADGSDVTDAALEEMSKGTILMHPPEIFGGKEDESVSRTSDDFDQSLAIYKRDDNRIIEEDPEATNEMQLPLEPHALVQAPPLSSSDLIFEDSVNKSLFPTRKSSLAQVRRRSSSNILRTDANSRRCSTTQPSNKSPMPANLESAEPSDSALDVDEAFTNTDRASTDVEKAFMVSRTNSVKMLAQRFTEAGRGNRVEVQQKEANIPKVYAFINPLPPNEPVRILEKSPERRTKNAQERNTLMQSTNVPVPRSLEEEFYFPPTPTISQAQPTEESSVTQPASASAHNSPEKECLIPKPLCEHGRGRQASRSPSPTKTSSPPKLASPITTPKSAKFFRNRPSVSNILPDHKDADTVVKYKPSRSPTSPLLPITNPELNRRSTTQNLAPPTEDAAPKTAPTKSLSDYSTASLQRLRAALEGPPIATHVVRPLSPHRPPLTATATKPTTTYTDHSTATDEPLLKLRRDMSVGLSNATMHTQIRQLQRQVDAKDKEVVALSRALDAERAMREGGKGTGQMGEEVREARRELETWRARAMWAEKRLEGLRVEVEVEYEEFARGGGGGGGGGE